MGKTQEVVEFNKAELGNDMELAKVFADSKMFPDIQTAAQGCIKILAGKELGLSPLQSLNSFYFVAGKLGIVAQAMGALVKKSGKYDYKIDSHTEQECVVSFYKVNGDKEKLGESKFDIKMAAKAGLANKSGWKNYPMNLLFARALMNGVRWYCPDAVAAFTYSVEELQDLDQPVKKDVITLNNGEVKNGEEKS